MLKTRLLTAFVGIPLVLYVFYGPFWLLVFVAVCAAGFSTYEIATLILPRFEKIFSIDGEQQESKPIIKYFGPGFHVPFCVILSITVFLTYHSNPANIRIGIVFLSVIVCMTVGALGASTNRQAVGRIVGYLVSVIYGTMPWFFVYDLYIMAKDPRYVILLFAIVWCGDTGAYFGGRYLGRNKLTPRISPSKTWEGVMFGLAASFAAGFIVNTVFGYALASFSKIFLVSFFGGVFGQIGDLVESCFKRFAEVKDSGNVFPGHGGFLDRVDGIVFAAPVVWFLLNIFSGM